MNDEKFNKWLQSEKERMQLKNEQTHYLRGITLGELVILRGGWYSQDLEDVKKLLANKERITTSSENGGLVEVGFNKKEQKYVGVHYLFNSIVENPVFENIDCAISWFGNKILELSIESS